MKGHTYTAQQLQFMASNNKIMTCKQLALAFNERFGTSLSANALRNKCDRSPEVPRKYANHHYTDEQWQYLRDNIINDEFKELSEKFNSKFGTNICTNTIKRECYRVLKIKRGVNASRAVIGDKNKRKIGAESCNNGYTTIKINSIRGDKSGREARNKNWCSKHKYVYEQARGEIPKDHIVVFLDNDKTNFSIDNLYCISRKINGVMSGNGWFSTDREVTLTAIKWCELHFAMKGEKKWTQIKHSQSK